MRWLSGILTVTTMLIALLLASRSRVGSSDWKVIWNTLNSAKPQLESESLLQNNDTVNASLSFDYYRDKCPMAETLVRLAMRRMYAQNDRLPAQLLRLLFHDCFIMGCDASVFLDDSGGNQSHPIEKQATPHLTLKGFDEIEAIKEEIEQSCPRVVSCADVLALATRDGILLVDGPFYPVLTGRKDSLMSFYNEASTQVPSPNSNVTQTLGSFSARGFSARETVALLGGHNIGKISCSFVRNRLANFSGTGMPDPSIPTDFLNDLVTKCNEKNSSIKNHKATLDSHYYRNVLKGRGVLVADQQLMANQITADIVRAYASDEGQAFRRDFADAMVKLSSLESLDQAEGQVRKRCSMRLQSEKTI